MGTLYPPDASPCYDGLTLAQVRDLRRTVRIKLDGDVVFAATADCYDASSGQVYLGTNPLWPSAESGRFSGTIRLTDRPPVDLAALRARARTETGPIAFQVEFPRDQPGYVDPLVATGVTRRADILFVRYLDDRHIRFGLDHWNGPQLLSPVVAVDYGRSHELGVYMGSLYPPAANVPAYLRSLLMIRLDGRMVWATRAVFHPAAPQTVDVGRNELGASTCRVSFKGNLFDVHRLKPPGPPVPATGRQAPQLLSICLPDAPESRREVLFKTIDETGQPLLAQIRYRDRQSIELGITAHGQTVWSPPLPADYTQFHDILVGLPVAAPANAGAAGGLTDYFRHQWQTGLHLYFDGRLAVAEASAQPVVAAAEWHWPDDILAGNSGAAEAIAGLLSRSDMATPFAAAPSDWNEKGGTLHLELRLPLTRIGFSDPLLAAGRTGIGDALFLRYVDDRHVQFGFDHWGFAALTSPVVAVDYGRVLPVDIDWDPAHGRLAVDADGREVWRTPARFFPSEGAASIGANLIGFSTCYPYFAGEIISARFDLAPTGPGPR